jgi:glycosyltransferase A (GT-A) superfamily protein (DUF2064 family)
MLTGSRALLDASPDPVLILGTEDAPTLTAGAIETAAYALDLYDMSIVHSVDGGTCSSGCAGPSRRSFAGWTGWSTEAVHRQTLERAEEAALSVQEGDPWYDVDESEDLARLLDEAAERPYLAPRTADFLERM